jgi:hypothetical protein
MIKMYRHGEVGLVKVSKLPKGLKQSDTKTLMSGSHGNSHSFDNGKLYLIKESDYVFGYLVAKNTTLYHAEHGDNGKAKIKDGIYQLLRQQEYTPQGLIPVID